MSSHSLLEEGIKYFKDNKGFARVFVKLKEKYRSLGRIGGTIVLTNLSWEERDALTGFLKKDCTKQKSITVSVDNFQKCLDASRYGGMLLEDIVRGYFGEELVSNKALQSSYEEARTRFFEELISRYSGSNAGEWLGYAWENKVNCYKTLIQRYEVDSSALRQDIQMVCQAVNYLPCLNGIKLRLPVFSSNITKNPHFFDDGTNGGQLLVYALMHLFDVMKPQNAEEKAELYYGAGILIDEVSNYVLCHGLKAYTQHGIHPGWEGFNALKEPVQATLANLGRLSGITSTTGKVYVVENPAVFTSLMDKAGDRPLPLVCTYGQVKISALMLLDMLSCEGTLIYYSGDFDPEGILIADKLKSRYKDKLVLWRYGRNDYETTVSSQLLNDSRLKKLDNLKDDTLVALARHIKQKCRVGYQELLIDQLAGDINQHY